MSPNKAQAELPMKELAEIEREAVNRPVPELDRTGEKEIIDIVTYKGNSENGKEPRKPTTHVERLNVAMDNMFMDTPCSHCGSSKVVRAGACGCCTECGTSQGCS